MSFRAQARNLLFRELPGWPTALSPLPILGEGKGRRRTNSVTLSLSKGDGAFRPLPLESGEGLGKGACRPYLLRLRRASRPITPPPRAASDEGSGTGWKSQL